MIQCAEGKQEIETIFILIFTFPNIKNLSMPTLMIWVEVRLVDNWRGIYTQMMELP